jgi:hypothetical protein
MKKFNMQNVFLWVKNDQNNGYKFRYSESPELIDGYLRLQIENSLRLGWDKEDIIVITNFPFEYMDVKSYIVDDICRWSAFANKMVVINEMIQKGIINDNFWLHDCDAYQLVSFVFPEECKDVNFVRHAPGREKPQGGSVFYRKEAFDIISVLSEAIRLFKPTKEESFFPNFYHKGLKLKAVTKYNSIIDKLEKNIDEKNKDNLAFYRSLRDFSIKYFGEFEDRFHWLNWTYNLFRQRQFHIKYPEAEKPIKVVHFHPEDQSCLDRFYHGKNNHNVKVVTPELSQLFIKHGLVK